MEVGTQCKASSHPSTSASQSTSSITKEHFVLIFAAAPSPPLDHLHDGWRVQKHSPPLVDPVEEGEKLPRLPASCLAFDQVHK